jgi:hypothetical protein
MKGFEIIYFSFLGFELQEPMALITNGLTFIFAFFAAFKLKNSDNAQVKLFTKFYFFLGISTLAGAFGHLFFLYFGLNGKIVSWVTAVLAGFYGALAMIQLTLKRNNATFFKALLIVKSLVLLTLCLVKMNFLFIAIDAILTYLIYFGVLSFLDWFKGASYMKYFWVGILVLLPSAFIYLMNINLHLWFNRDDFSHVLMFLCIVFFFLSIRKYEEYTLKSEN